MPESPTHQSPAHRSASNQQFSSLGQYHDPVVGSAVECLMEPVLRLAGALAPGARVLDVGCGLGALAAEFARRGCNVVGIDLDEHNLEVARQAYRDVRFVRAAADESVLDAIGEGPFDLVTCTEVVEHVYSASSLLRGCFMATKPGGRLIISAPYHGYLKNLVIATLGKCDGHYNPLWEGGHIRFFSRRTMTRLMEQTG